MKRKVEEKEDGIEGGSFVLEGFERVMRRSM